jgi:hypothetical protein
MKYVLFFCSDLIHEVNNFTKPVFRFPTKCSGEKVRPRPLNNPPQFCGILQLCNYASLAAPQDAKQTVSCKKSRHVFQTQFTVRSPMLSTGTAGCCVTSYAFPSLTLCMCYVLSVCCLCALCVLSMCCLCCLD